MRQLPQTLFLPTTRQLFTNSFFSPQSSWVSVGAVVSYNMRVKECSMHAMLSNGIWKYQPCKNIFFIYQQQKMKENFKGATRLSIDMNHFPHWKNYGIYLLGMHTVRSCIVSQILFSITSTTSIWYVVYVSTCGNTISTKPLFSMLYHIEVTPYITVSEYRYIDICPLHIPKFVQIKLLRSQ